MEARLFRTWNEGGVTVVDGVATVPLSILAASTQSRYRFEVAVRDGEGNVLYRDSWERPVSRRASELAGQGATLRESFQFGLRPGNYVVALTAHPADAPQLAVGTEQAIQALSDAPVASDLLLAHEIAPLEDEEDPARWPIRRSGMGISASPELVLMDDAPELYYYLELYVPEGEGWSGRVWADIRGKDGRIVYQTPEQPVSVDVPGRSFPGRLSVAGLPAGEYELVMHVEGPERAETRNATFRMIDRPVAPVQLAEGPHAEYFAHLSEEELESLFGGVGLLLTDTQRRTFEAFPPDAKRRFLVDFFGAQDPDPTTTDNEFLDEYLKRIGAIHLRYGETTGVEERKPWLTPRGRIYLKHGEPTDRIEERFPGAGADFTLSGRPQPPYEIWYYGKTTGFVYLFVDETSFGEYRLVYSTDPDIQSMPDWQARAGAKAIDDLQINFGINVRFQTGSSN